MKIQRLHILVPGRACTFGAALVIGTAPGASADSLGAGGPSLGVFASADARDLGTRDGDPARWGGYVRIGVVPGLGLEMSGIAQRDGTDRVEVYTANVLIGASGGGPGVFAFAGYGRARVKGRPATETPAYTLGAAARIAAIGFPLALEVGGRYSFVDVVDSDAMTFTQLFFGLDVGF